MVWTMNDNEDKIEGLGSVVLNVSVCLEDDQRLKEALKYVEEALKYVEEALKYVEKAYPCFVINPL
jgi:hypothetical protein